MVVSTVINHQASCVIAVIEAPLFLLRLYTSSYMSPRHMIKKGVFWFKTRPTFTKKKCLAKIIFLEYRGNGTIAVN